MRTVLVETLVEYLRAQLGTSGADDLLYMWVEEAVGVVREQPWPWNWTETADITYAPYTPDYTWTWNIGDTFITANAAFGSGISYEYTGRRVKLGDEWYTIVDIGLTQNDRIYVDRPIVSEALNADPQTVIFYRRDRTVSSSRIINVAVNVDSYPKIMRYDPHYFYRRYSNTSPDQLDPSTPQAYKDHMDRRIDPPAYPPVVSDSGGGLNFTEGRYVYFYTRYDLESKLESPPGPPVEVVVDYGGNHPSVIYGNSVSVNDSENTTYGLRLYRSEVDPSRKRPPMFRLLERSPFAAVAGAFVDGNTDGTLYNKPALYEGPQTTIALFPPPSTERLSFIISHLDNWARRAHDRDRVSMGTDNQIIELLRIFLLGVVKLAGKNPNEYRSSVVQFRQQMHYLATEARKAGENDVGGFERYHDDRAMVTTTRGDWVDHLPWSGD